ncbi:beta-eliminating lyase-related protein [Variovorax sp. MHTC-1]|uniref:beta-eliminating lyase-related protein n=1 Tax=Variovorax sp. MHTC-1 TaxID=2495593 RepID=UPI000F8887A9|nr:beta-eliminating lyase-related protein [Variovorax sp. MHTC-1]RST52652.1 hypothetical protein EJI01_15715 [Variovorax sp. MHTC-1]
MTIFRYSAEDAQLHEQCSFRVGIIPNTLNLGSRLHEIQQWIDANDIKFADLESGATQKSFEARIAALLGVEDCLFVISGAAACQIAVRIWAAQSGKREFGMHATSHMEFHEDKSYSMLHALRAVWVGSYDRPLSSSDLEVLADEISCLVVELPCRHVGGNVLPTMEEIRALRQIALTRQIKLHLDGARLWVCRPQLQTNFADVVNCFDSSYVSFSKEVGAMGGGMLAGSRKFVTSGRVWANRQGIAGDRHPAVLLDAMRCFEGTFMNFDNFVMHAREVARLLKASTFCLVVPEIPNTNMFRAYFPVSVGRMMAARARLALQAKQWVGTWFAAADMPEYCYTEIVISLDALRLEPQAIADAFRRLSQIADEA